MLDSAFAKPSVFKKLYKKAHLVHIRHDLNLSPETEDKQIYNLATKENRIIITQDIGFKKWIKPKGTGVFIIASYLSNKQIDDLLTNFIAEKNPDDFKGKVTRIK